MGRTLYFESNDPSSRVARISALLFSVKTAKLGSHNHSQLLKIASWLKSFQVKKRRLKKSDFKNAETINNLSSDLLKEKHRKTEKNILKWVDNLHMICTLDSESKDPSSNLGKTSRITHSPFSSKCAKRAFKKKRISKNSLPFQNLHLEKFNRYCFMDHLLKNENLVLNQVLFYLIFLCLSPRTLSTLSYWEAAKTKTEEFFLASGLHRFNEKKNTKKLTLKILTSLKHETIRAKFYK